jgi:hypothetical protein
MLFANLLRTLKQAMTSLLLTHRLSAWKDGWSFIGLFSVEGDFIPPQEFTTAQAVRIQTQAYTLGPV